MNGIWRSLALDEVMRVGPHWYWARAPYPTCTEVNTMELSVCKKEKDLQWGQSLRKPGAKNRAQICLPDHLVEGQFIESERDVAAYWLASKRGKVLGCFRADVSDYHVSSQVACFLSGWAVTLRAGTFDLITSKVIDYMCWLLLHLSIWKSQFQTVLEWTLEAFSERQLKNFDI
jgi:hypothetical protein